MGFRDVLFGPKKIFRDDGIADISDMRRVVAEWARLNSSFEENERNWSLQTASRSSELREKMRLLEGACVADSFLTPAPFKSHQEAASAFAGQDLTRRLRDCDRGAVMALQARLLPRTSSDVAFVAERFLAAAAQSLDDLSDAEAANVRGTVSELNYWFVGLLYERVIVPALGSPTNVYIAQNIRHAMVSGRNGYLKSIGAPEDHDVLKQSADSFAGWMGTRLDLILHGNENPSGLCEMLAQIIGSHLALLFAEATRKAWVTLAREKTAPISAALLR